MYISRYVEFERQITVPMSYAQFGTRCGTPSANAIQADIKVSGPLDQYGFVIDNTELSRIRDYFKAHTNFSVSCEQLALAIAEHVLHLLGSTTEDEYSVEVKVTGNVPGGAWVTGHTASDYPQHARSLNSIFHVIDGKLCYTAPATL